MFKKEKIKNNLVGCENYRKSYCFASFDSKVEVMVSFINYNSSDLNGM